MRDRLAEIKKHSESAQDIWKQIENAYHWGDGFTSAFHRLLEATNDRDWLIAEVERLRGDVHEVDSHD